MEITNETILRGLRRINQFPDLFTIYEQQEENAENYLKSTFGCLYMPEDFIQFISRIDGIRLYDMTVFSISDNKPGVILTYDRYSSEEVMKQYFENVNKPIKDKMLFIGADRNGGRYAIRTNKEDNKVYLIGNSDIICTYPSFAALLCEKIEETINNNI